MSDQHQQMLDEMRGAIVDMAAVVAVLAQEFPLERWQAIKDRLWGMERHVEKINELSKKQ